jgi:hypothetical protein
MKLLAFLVAGFVAALSPTTHAAAVACSGQPGAVNDPLGDAWIPGDPDIVCTSVQVVGGQLVLSEAFGANFAPATTRAGFYLDTDQSAATGTSDFRTPGMGIDFHVAFGGTGFDNLVRLWTASSNSWSSLGFAFQVFDDGYSVSIPLALLDTDGALNFAGISSTRLSAEGSTGVLDFTAVGSTAARDLPEPGSAVLALTAVGGLLATRRRVRRGIAQQRRA